MEDSFTPSAMAAFSYRWNKGTANNESCLAKCFHALQAFASAMCGPYTVDRASLDENYLTKYENSIFCKEYRKINDLKITRTEMTRTEMTRYNTASINKRQNKPVDNKRQNKPVDKDIAKKRNELTNELTNKGIKYLREINKKKVLKIKAEDFKALMLQGKFEDDIHYIVDGSIDFSNYPHKKTPPLSNITMPKYLTVMGCVSMDYQPNFTKLPEIFIVKGNLSLTHCSGITDLFNSKLLIYGDLYFSYCINMRFAPNVILGQFNIYFSDCYSLEQPPEYLDLGGAVPPTTTGCREHIIQAFNLKIPFYSKLHEWLG